MDVPNVSYYEPTSVPLEYKRDNGIAWRQVDVSYFTNNAFLFSKSSIFGLSSSEKFVDLRFRDFKRHPDWWIYFDRS